VVFRRTMRSGVLSLSILYVLTAVFAASAHAAPEIVAGPGMGAGQVLTPRSTAVNQGTGDLYVGDFNFLGMEGSTARISKFDSEGEFLLAWGWGVADESDELQMCGPEASPPTAACFTAPFAASATGAGAIFPDAVAVDQSTGAVYVVDQTHLRVTKFSPSGEFVFMVGKEVNQGGGTPSNPGNICTAEHLQNGDVCGSGGSGTGPNEFSNPLSLAVDSAGVVWVGDNERISSLTSSGAPGPEILLPGEGATKSLALDSSGNFYVLNGQLESVRKLEAGTGMPLETLDGAGFPRSVTLDASDNVYIGDCGDPSFSCPAYQFKRYNAAGEQTYQFGEGQVIGAPEGNSLSVGVSANRLYAASSRTEASERVVQAFLLPEPGPLIENQGFDEILPTQARVFAKINPEGHETTYRFEYGTSESYGQSTAAGTLTNSGFGSEDVEAQLKALTPDTTYHFRVVASNHCNPAEPAEECTTHGEDQTFTTLPAISIISQWPTDVTATTAILHAEMDPLGVEAEVWLEYGTSDGYGQIIALGNLGNGFGLVVRQAALVGLQPGTTYHFRFVGRDERDGHIYAVYGRDRSFTTQFGGIGFDLPDNRIWEMVSPADKHGASLALNTETSIQASADGNGVVYSGSLPIEADPEGFREFSTNLAQRDGQGLWRSKDITTPNAKLAPLSSSNGGEYKLFRPDLSEALLEPRSGTPLSLEASERTPYWRRNSEPPSYRPLVTDKEGFANVPPGTGFGGEADPSRALAYVRIQAATPDLRHVVLMSERPLGPGTVPFNGIYEWFNGDLEPVSVLPDAEGGGMVEARLGSGANSVRNAISTTGSRIFWSSLFPGGLYLRDSGDVTSRLDVKRGGTGEGTAQPIFQGASTDGTVVFFTDSQQLTPGASPSGFDLYRCEIPEGAAAAGCATLSDLSAPAGAGKSAEVQGIVSALSADGSRVYFVAKGVLNADPNQNGDAPISGAPNLYRWENGDGVRFIGTLSAEDRANWGMPGTVPAPGRTQSLSATASPSGRYLAFTSQRNLLGYDNRDAATNEPVHEVYRYDAVADRLDCISCNPSGARPHGRIPGRALVDPLSLWQGQTVAAVVPEAFSLYEEGITIYRPRVIFDSGRVFFNAVDSLVAADSNGEWDVYQHEPFGVGDCTATSGGASLSVMAGGCVSLLSSGTAEEEAGFLDASATGDDAFFLTAARLSVLDGDEELDVYDARVNGVEAIRPLHTECLGEACQPAGQAPNDPTPASAAFKGPGNVVDSRDCRAMSHRVKRLGSRAKVLRGRAETTTSPQRSKLLRRKAKHLSRKAQVLGKRAKSCRPAGRRASS
jgi:hypothetical protein